MRWTALKVLFFLSVTTVRLLKMLQTHLMVFDPKDGCLIYPGTDLDRILNPS